MSARAPVRRSKPATPGLDGRLTKPQLRALAAEHGLKEHTVIARYKRGERGADLIARPHPNDSTRLGRGHRPPRNHPWIGRPSCLPSTDKPQWPRKYRGPNKPKGGSS